MVKAPWDKVQVAYLNAYQQSGWHHPFTCGNESCRATLVARPSGWECPVCHAYEQDWAHAFMADGSWNAGGSRTTARAYAADEAFADHDFGDETVKDTGGWESSGDDWSLPVYLENGDETSTRVTFRVRFEPGVGKVKEAWLER